MIYNRTYIDIINAKKLITNKIKKNIDLTEQEQAIMDRALFNLTTINRITAKIDEIWAQIVLYGGQKIESEDVREWGDQEIFISDNFSNIRSNIGHIMSQLSKFEFIEGDELYHLHGMLNGEYTYTNLNNLEKLLYDIYNVLDKFTIQSGNTLYILGAYNATLVLEDLTIE